MLTPKESSVVVLVGPMGVGKTTVGKKLARALKVPFCDTDAMIMGDHGPIADIFANQGEAAFRHLEHLALLRALGNDGVVATGGGAVLLEESRIALQRATVVYLSTDGKHMNSRLSKGNRPLLSDGIETWKKIYESRRDLYERVADIEIDTSDQPLAQTISEIKEKLGI